MSMKRAFTAAQPQPQEMLRRPPASIRVSSLLLSTAKSDSATALQRMGALPEGLSETEAQDRLRRHGPNSVTPEHHHPWLSLLVKGLANPLVLLLVALAIISFLTDDYRAGTVMLVMVALGVVLRFVQEVRADSTAARLKSMIRVTSTVIREGREREVPLAELVPGDLIRLSAGDMIPADVRLLVCKDLFVIQASLTGESFPIEKFHARETAAASPLEYGNICFLGTSVESGTATALVVATGRETYLGSMASALMRAQPETEFDKGINRFVWLMIRFIAV